MFPTFPVILLVSPSYRLSKKTKAKSSVSQKGPSSFNMSDTQQHATECNARRNIHPVGTQVAENRDPFSGSRHVRPQRAVDRAIPSFLILMNPVSLKYGRGPPLLLVPGSRDSPGPGVTRYRPPYRGGSNGGIVPHHIDGVPLSPPLPPLAEVQTEEHRSTHRVRVIGEAPLIIALIKHAAITVDYRARSSANLNYVSPSQRSPSNGTIEIVVSLPVQIPLILSSRRKQTYLPPAIRDE